MSASPTNPSAATTKRPLEDPSSPSGLTDQPDAKRPALDKVARNGDEAKVKEEVSTSQVSQIPAVDDSKDVQGDTVVPDAPTGSNDTDSKTKSEPQPIQSTASHGDRATTQNETEADESTHIYIRCIITTQEAATVIGKGGENVSQIRRMSGAKCVVSDYHRGAVERILTVSGTQDIVAKGFGLIIRTLNNEPLDVPSTAQSKTYALRLLIPHILIGSIIGKGGVRIREIQVASGARLTASDACAPFSTERSVTILGVADAVHIATYYVAVTLSEQLTARYNGPAASNYATRTGAAVTPVPGGMIVIPFVPMSMAGNWGQSDHYNKRPHQAPPPAAGYGAGPYGQNAIQPAMPYVAPPAQYPVAPQHPGQPQFIGPQAPNGRGPPTGPAGAIPSVGGLVTQQIFIPNDMVGAIIGKGGAKINEIRHLSGSNIKINEPQDNNNERLVTVSGTHEANQMALYMLYARLESEKHRP
ncbi:hypothetical protein N7495_004278 [Penicillium taxi]|uniref:uncharacterized protein n=1 Tax=Penicillium taxi TaxID=168475 RepID=UPI002545129C|nr:uncharacterized protein N7495_004278 [Penicillium taxi]KAJ5899534.1 hypothetical protein N7495_004278 [Penicillium taxi]